MKPRISLFCLLLSFCSVVIIFAQSNPVLLIVRSSGENFEEAVSEIRYELESELAIHELLVDSLEPLALTENILAMQPKILVLMDNRSINVYREALKDTRVREMNIPSVSLIGILIDKCIADIPHSTGIAYEVPIVTGAVNLRSILPNEIHNIGVMHRAPFDTFIAQNVEFCAREDIVITAVELGHDLDISLLKKDLKYLVEEKQIDVLWVPNDNRILNSSLLKSLWQPFQKKYRLPIIVGVESLVNPLFHFGTFAVMPDHAALGNQAANLIYDIMDNGWKIEESGIVQPPLSIYTTINFPDAQRYWSVERQSLLRVDSIWE